MYHNDNDVILFSNIHFLTQIFVKVKDFKIKTGYGLRLKSGILRRVGKFSSSQFPSSLSHIPSLLYFTII